MLLIRFENFPADIHVPTDRKNPSEIEHMMLLRKWKEHTARTLLECTCEFPFLGQEDVHVVVGDAQLLPDHKVTLLSIDDLTAGKCQLSTRQLRAIVERAGRAAVVWMQRTEWRVIAVSHVGSPQLPDIRWEGTFGMDPNKNRPTILTPPCPPKEST